MKNIFTFLALCATAFFYAQAPNLFSYQAVVRNPGNNLAVNQTVGLKFSIIKTSVNGTVSYAETQNISTNANGLVTAQLGNGAVVSGSIANIDWSSDLYFVKTEIDPSGGTSYSISGTQQLLSVPYALSSKSVSDGAVTTGKISNSAVTSAKLADASVTTAKISATGTPGSSNYLRGDGSWAPAGGATLELIADKVSGTSESVPVAVTTAPTTIVYNNVVSAPLSGVYNSTTGVYTVGSNGVYMIQARVHGSDASPTNNTVSYCLNLQINNAAWGSTNGGIIYGLYTPLNVYTPVNTKARGELICYVKLNQGDQIKVIAHGTNSTVAPQNTIADAGSNLMIMKMN